MSESSELPPNVFPLKDKNGNLVKPPKKGLFSWLSLKKPNLNNIGENSGSVIRTQFMVYNSDGTKISATKLVPSAFTRENLKNANNSKEEDGSVS